MNKEFNIRKFAEEVEVKNKNKSIISLRARRMDSALRVAYENNLPVRVIICDGVRRDIIKHDGPPSKVEKRILDPIKWIVSNYEYSTGNTVLLRGGEYEDKYKYIDQFSDTIDVFKKSKTQSEVFVRNPRIRNRVLKRANGKCELCGSKGFFMNDGSVFLETHHIIPLSENGKDIVENVAALCPNHHREAHYGKKAEDIKSILLKKMKQFYK